MQLDGRIVDCAQAASASNPVCRAHAAASASPGPLSRLAVSPLVGMVSVTRNVPYSILPFSFALTASVDCAAMP